VSKRFLVSCAAVLIVCLGASTATARRDPPAPKVAWVELKGSLEGRTVLLLRVKQYDRGLGKAVQAYRRADSAAYARPVRGSHELWRIGPRDSDGVKLIQDIVQHIQEKGVATVKAAVLADTPAGGIIRYFRIKGFDEHTSAIGFFQKR
jgi:hypothetical protein